MKELSIEEKVKIDVDSSDQQHIIFNNDCVVNSIIAKGNKTLLINVKSK